MAVSLDRLEPFMQDMKGIAAAVGMADTLGLPTADLIHDVGGALDGP